MYVKDERKDVQKKNQQKDTMKRWYVKRTIEKIYVQVCKRQVYPEKIEIRYGTKRYRQKRQIEKMKIKGIQVMQDVKEQDVQVYATRTVMYGKIKSAKGSVGRKSVKELQRVRGMVR